MPQVSVYLGRKESKIVEKYRSQSKIKISKTDAIIDMINEFEDVEEEEIDG
jgi:hypothetical protein